MKELTSIYWIKNEARYIPEYIEFHLLNGFDHFIFYDNDSNDNIEEIVDPYKELVEIRKYPENIVGSKNFWLMHHCIYEQRNKSRWIHFNAIDERIFCPDGNSLLEKLENYHKHGAISVCWKLFNSNGHIKRPNGLIIDNFTKYHYDPMGHVKTVIRPENIDPSIIANPHNFNHYNGYSVNENFQEVHRAICGNCSYKEILIHHYFTLSEEEWNIKYDKGVLDRCIENSRRPDGELWWNYSHNESNTYYYDDTLSKKYSLLIKDKLMYRYKDKKHLLNYINH